MSFSGFQWLLALTLLVSSPSLLGATTGKSAAMKYFSKKRSPAQSRITQKTPVRSSGDSQTIGFSVGTLLSGKSYQWAGEDISGWNMEASYQSNGQGYFGHGFHLEYQNFADPDQEFNKLAFLFSLSFPRRLSFPVYVGVAAGPGLFFKQKADESEFTLDYKAYLGLRLNQEHSQYFIQSGVKNHIHMLSDGQFVGWFISSGVSYKF